MSRPLINNKYRITRRVGGGSFGDIYLGVGSTGEKVAVKFEKHGARCPQLRHEYKVYRELQNAPVGFAKVHYFGTQDSYNLMVMDLLGPSLEDQFNKCERSFSLKTVLLIADQMLERVELMHSRHLIHRDIKPANFVTGGAGGSANCIYCIDFGLSKRYRHPRTLQHIPQREGRSLTGTPRYASINNHLGVEQSRRDDLESIGYVLIYFLRGGLPWQGLKAKSASKKYKLIMEKKQNVTITALCSGCPSQFAEYLAYCRSLKFEAKPNIAYLRGMFRDLFRSQGYTNANSALDWDWNRVDNQGPIKEPGPPGNDNANDNNDVEMIADRNGGDEQKRPDTAAAVGRPDTAAAIRPDTSGTNRRTSAPTTYYENNDTKQQQHLSSNQNNQQQTSVYQAYSSGQQVAPPTFDKSSWSRDREAEQNKVKSYNMPNNNTYNGSNSGVRPRPSTASRAIGNSSGTKPSSSSGPGTRPSTAYGPRSSSTPKDQQQSSSKQKSSHDHAQASSGQHVAGSAGRSIMRYRRTRAATDGQVDTGNHHSNQQAWRPDGSNSGSSNRLPVTSGGNKASLLNRKGEVTPAWDRPTSSQPKSSSHYQSGGYKYGSSGSGGMGRPRPSSSGTGRR